MCSSSEAVAPAIGISKVDASAKLGGKGCFTYSALVVADDLGDRVLCFVCSDLMHCDFDERVRCVSAFGAILVVMIARVKRWLVFLLCRFLFLKEKLIGFVGCSN